MKTLYTFLGALLLLSNLTNAQDRCATTEHQTMIMGLNPQYKQNLDKIEEFTQKFISEQQQQQQGGVIVTIPVIVHVVYNTVAENVSDAQIFSQMDILNEDFRKMNSDWTSTPAAFQSLVADVNIEFCLASVDPNGNPTTGIVRTSTSATSFVYTSDAVKFDSSGGDDAWPSASYLNLWVCDLSGGILGYAQFPGGPANTDGVVIDYAAFGNIGSAAAPFNLGRTATHEVGHWLNLYHIWGDDGTSCGGSDLVADTPNQADENYNCPAFPTVSCSNGPNGDMFMNYMDYVNDACMFMFTNGQAARMQANFVPGGAKDSFLSSQGCGISSGCITLQMYDSYGDGWNGATYTVTNSMGATVATGTLANGYSGSASICPGEGCFTIQVTGGSYPGEVSWAINGANEINVSGGANTTASFTVGTVIYGCTSMFSCNYNIAANCDDGSCSSCFFSNCFQMVMTDSYGDGWNGATYTVYNSSGSVVTSGTMDSPNGSVDINALCLNDGCYTMQVTGGVYPSEVGWTLYGANEGPFSGGANTSIGFSVGTLEFGCTDPGACNYWGGANCDDGTCVYCFNNCLSILMTDSYGDGWNGAAYSINDVFGNQVTSGTMDSGNGSLDVNAICLENGCYTISVSGGIFPAEVGWTLYGANEGSISGGAFGTISFSVGYLTPGCTEPFACNYNPSANCDDGSCVYCFDYCLSLTMYDGFGDYWDIAGYQVTDASGAVVLSGTMDSGNGSIDVNALCLPAGCYNISFTGGYFPGEISWSLNGANEGPISGGAFASANFSVGGIIPGCTIPGACNYNPAFNCNDGTCVYCPGACLSMLMTDSYGDGWNGGQYQIYNVQGVLVMSGAMDSGNGSIDMNALCLNSGCYQMVITGGSFPSEIGWTFYGANEGTFGGGAPSNFFFTVGAPVYGCANSSAANYNPLATCDNGTCVFSCVGDFDNNGVVNTSDLLLFMAQFGCPSSCGMYDLDGNGVVNTSDLLLFMAIFGTLCP